MKILIFAASLRKDSLNKKLAHQAQMLLASNRELILDHCDFRSFEMPVYDGDLEVQAGIPAGTKLLSQKIAEANAVIISTPEYNGGIPGPLKNALDWVSRTTPNPLSGKPVLLLGASPGALGAVRGLWHTRVPFEVLGAVVHSEMFGLPKAHEAFSEGDVLKDAKTTERLEKLLKTFLNFAKQLSLQG